MRIDATQSADCSGTCPNGGDCVNRCPVLSHTWPTNLGVSASDYEVEAWVAFDSNVVQLGQFAGIGLGRGTQSGTANFSLSLYAGLQVSGLVYTAASWQVRVQRQRQCLHNFSFLYA